MFVFFFLRCQSSNSVLRRKSSNAPLTQTLPGFESGCAGIPVAGQERRRGPGVHPSMLHPLFPLPAQYMKLYTRPHPSRGSKQHPLVVCCSVYFVHHCIFMNSPALLLIHLLSSLTGGEMLTVKQSNCLLSGVNLAI